MRLYNLKVKILWILTAMILLSKDLQRFYIACSFQLISKTLKHKKLQWVEIQRRNFSIKLPLVTLIFNKSKTTIRLIPKVLVKHILWKERRICKLTLKSKGWCKRLTSQPALLIKNQESRVHYLLKIREILCWRVLIRNRRWIQDLLML